MISLYGNPCDRENFLRRLLSRSQLDMSEARNIVREIIDCVREKGDDAVFEFTRKFDKVEINKATIEVSREEIEEAYEAVDESLLEVVRRASYNIRNFHQKQLQKTWMDMDKGKILGQVIRPIEKVGVYVPGGTAAYPSSVLMNVIPAKVAGVKEIIMVTPPGIDGKAYSLTVVTAMEAGVDKIYKIGGAQAIAALAFGTKIIPKVDKIVGPGNIYVALAKREVFGYVGIDMIAGPSEILVIADSTANPSFVAADLLSQAEHDPLSAAVLITDNMELACNVKEEIEKQVEQLERKDIIVQSLKSYGALIIVEDMEEALDLANIIAPEHLELVVENPFELMGGIKNAGAIFLGHYSPEPLGDYFAGPNHVLPTCGTSRFFSPLTVDDFMKKSSILYYSPKALEDIYEDIITFAQAEGLSAHANSLKVRFAYRG